MSKAVSEARERARSGAAEMVAHSRAANAAFEAEHGYTHVTEADYQHLYRTLVRRFMAFWRKTHADELGGADG